MPSQWARAFVFASIIGVAPSAAFGQTATALDRFEPAPAGDGSFAVPRASVLGHLNPKAGLTLSYANEPLKARIYDDASGQTTSEADVVSYQLVAHLQASVEFVRRIKLDLDVPFTMSQGGNSPKVVLKNASSDTAPLQSFPSPSGPAMNDIRLGARLALLRQRGWIPAASIAYAVWFPSGNDKAYTSTGFVRMAPSLIVGAEHGRYVWSVMLGRRGQDPRDNGLLGSEVLGGASFSAQFDKLSAHVEMFGSTATNDKAALASGKSSLELIFGGRYNFGLISAGLMGGPGLAGGIGTPTFRILANVTASFDSFVKSEHHAEQTSHDSNPYGKWPNTDVVHSSKPAPPPLIPLTPKEPLPPDRDGDTVADKDDVCPDVAGDASITAAKRGCPADRDGDGIADVDDRCPNEKGVATPDLAKFGCPLDSDGDGFTDAVDACPKEKGEASEDAKKNGCPRSVRVEGSQIVILQEVKFATGSDVITADSFGVLDQVAAVLKQHSEITSLAVDGHTDDSGPEKDNLTLSQKRAVSVVTWLVDHGIDSRRLISRGFGPRRPIAKNNSTAGKAKNRRVEFQILKRSEEGGTDGRAGSIE